MKRLRVLVLLHPDLIPPELSAGYTEQQINVWKTEYDVVSTLRAAGHEVRPLGVHDELKPIRDEIDSWKPDVAFSLLEQFHGEVIYDQNVVSYLELMRVPYTGCNPRGLMLARGKDLSKTLVHYHRIPVPAFAVFPKHRKVRRPTRLGLPLIVKSVSEDLSWGISQASVVDSDEKLEERVTFIHERIGTAAIAEQYVEGRELYVGVLGNDRLRVLPVWELEFGNMAHGRMADRDGEGQARSRLSGASRDQARAGQGSRSGSARPYPTIGQADLPDLGSRRICSNRFSLIGGRYSVFSRSKSQSRDRRESGIFRGGAARWDRVPRPPASHYRTGYQTGNAGGVCLNPATRAVCQFCFSSPAALVTR